MKHKQFSPNLIEQTDILEDGRERKAPKSHHFAEQAAFSKQELPSFTSPGVKPSLPSSQLSVHNGKRQFPHSEHTVSWKAV